MTSAKNMVACAECQVVGNNRRMILPRRPQHAIAHATPDDRPTARKLCVGCELLLRKQEAAAKGVPCTDTLEGTRLEVIGNNSSRKQASRVYAYTESVDYVTQVKAEGPALARKVLRGMRAEHHHGSDREIERS